MQVVDIQESCLYPRQGVIKVPDGASKREVRLTIEKLLREDCDEEAAAEGRWVAKQKECPFLGTYVRDVLFSIHDLRDYTEARYVATIAVVMVKNY